jgi:hypothetical protein
MANTTAEEVAMGLRKILSYAGNTGSVNFYMAHGGTNWGPWAGANVLEGMPVGGRRGEADLMSSSRRSKVKAGGGSRGVRKEKLSEKEQGGTSRKQIQQQLRKQSAGMQGSAWQGSAAAAAAASVASGSGGAIWTEQQQQQQQQQQQHATDTSQLDTAIPSFYLPHITSYDYASPIGEAGTYGQLGIGGSSKFDALRAEVALAQQVEVSQLPAAPPPPLVMPYGTLMLTEQKSLLETSDVISSSCQGSRYFGQHGGEQQASREQQQGVDGDGSRDLLGRKSRSSGRSSADAAATVRGGGDGGDGGGDSPIAVAVAAASSSGGGGGEGLFIPSSPGPPGIQPGTQVPSPPPPAAAPVLSNSMYPESMEQYGQHYGLLVYETHLPAHLVLGGGQLMLAGVRDTAWVYLGGNMLGYSYRAAAKSIYIPPLMRRRKQQQEQDQQQLWRAAAAAAGGGGGGGAAAPGETSGFGVQHQHQQHQQQQEHQHKQLHKSLQVHRRLKTSPNLLQV